MKLIDTHNHLYLEDFDPEQDQLITVAKESGIDTLLFPNVDTTTIERMHDLCDRYPDFAYPMMGLHPTSVDKHYAENLKVTESWLGKRSYCGIGEIGIDLYWDKTYLKEQKEVFEEQLRWSIDLNLPVAIHTREAYPEVFDSLYKVGADSLSGVFHSFTGNETELEEIKKLKNFKKVVDKHSNIRYTNLRCDGQAQMCGCSSMVEHQPSKLDTWVRFPSPALFF